MYKIPEQNKMIRNKAKRTYKTQNRLLSDGTFNKFKRTTHEMHLNVKLGNLLLESNFH
jgi:hypothetical protein